MLKGTSHARTVSMLSGLTCTCLDISLVDFNVFRVIQSACGSGTGARLGATRDAGVCLVSLAKENLKKSKRDNQTSDWRTGDNISALVMPRFQVGFQAADLQLS